MKHSFDRRRELKLIEVLNTYRWIDRQHNEDELHNNDSHSFCICTSFVKLSLTPWIFVFKNGLLLLLMPRHKHTQNACICYYHVCTHKISLKRLSNANIIEICQEPFVRSLHICKWVLSIEDLFHVSKSIKFATHTVMNDGNGRPPLMILYQTVCERI